MMMPCSKMHCCQTPNSRTQQNQAHFKNVIKHQLTQCNFEAKVCEICQCAFTRASAIKPILACRRDLSSDASQHLPAGST